MSSDDFSKLVVPPPDPHNVQATKEYIFNETGNIMLASTSMVGQTIPDEVRAVFAEVSVFFAAMTKAISESINPATGKGYSLYDYTAIQNVIDGSGLFVHVTEEDVVHKSSSFGMDFSKELIEALLGLATGTGELAFAQAMVSSLGKAGLEISASHSSTDSKVANIVFVCEYLLGMPVISAIVVYCDLTKNQQAFSIGPCIKEHSRTVTLKMHKDTYMFVTPTFIRQYSGDLDSVTSDLKYLEFIDYLEALVQGTPIVTAVEDLNGDPAPSELEIGKTYAITGAFLNNGRKLVTKGTDKGKPTVRVAWVGANDTMGPEVVNAQVQGNVISFSVKTATTTPAAIGVFFTNDEGKNPALAVASDGVYNAVAAS